MNFTRQNTEESNINRSLDWSYKNVSDKWVIRTVGFWTILCESKIQTQFLEIWHWFLTDLCHNKKRAGKFEPYELCSEGKITPSGKNRLLLVGITRCRAQPQRSDWRASHGCDPLPSDVNKDLARQSCVHCYLFFKPWTCNEFNSNTNQIKSHPSFNLDHHVPILKFCAVFGKKRGMDIYKWM